MKRYPHFGISLGKSGIGKKRNAYFQRFPADVCSGVGATCNLWVLRTTFAKELRLPAGAASQSARSAAVSKLLDLIPQQNHPHVRRRDLLREPSAARGRRTRACWREGWRRRTRPPGSNRGSWGRSGSWHKCRRARPVGGVQGTGGPHPERGTGGGRAVGLVQTRRGPTTPRRSSRPAARSAKRPPPADPREERSSC